MEREYTEKDLAMQNDVDRALNILKKASKHSSELLQRLSNTSEKLGRKNSSTLFGTFGGLLGAGVGTALSYATGISLLALSTSLTGLGIVAAILIYRGPRRIILEKEIAENRIACDEILSRIKNLPRNAPEEVKQELWNTYRQLNSVYQQQTRVLLLPRKSETDALLLPEETENQPEQDET